MLRRPAGTGRPAAAAAGGQEAAAFADTGTVAAGDCREREKGECARRALDLALAHRLSHQPPTSLPSSLKSVRAAHGAAEAGALQLAHHPTLGLYYVRDHVRSSLPAALAARAALDRAASAATTAASHLDAAAGAVTDIRGAAPGALAAMEASVRRAAGAAEELAAVAAAGRRRKPGWLGK